MSSAVTIQFGGWKFVFHILAALPLAGLSKVSPYSGAQFLQSLVASKHGTPNMVLCHIKYLKEFEKT